MWSICKNLYATLLHTWCHLNKCHTTIEYNSYLTYCMYLNDSTPVHYPLRGTVHCTVQCLHLPPPFELETRVLEIVTLAFFATTQTANRYVRTYISDLFTNIDIWHCWCHGQTVKLCAYQAVLMSTVGCNCPETGVLTSSTRRILATLIHISWQLVEFDSFGFNREARPYGRE